MSNILKSCLTFLTILSALTLFMGAAKAETQTCPERELVKSGTFVVTVRSVGVIIGVRWGRGKIRLNNGDIRKFTLSGGKLLDLGVSEKTVSGNLYNLDNINDFPGIYLGIGGGLAVATKGLGRLSVTNGKCVVMNGGTDEAQGLAVTNPIGPGGVKIEWAN